MDKEHTANAKTLAKDHVDWLIGVLSKVVQVIGEEEFKHGYEHGVEAEKERAMDKYRDSPLYP